MHVHGAALHRNVRTPDHLQDGLTGHDQVGVLQQKPQQAVLLVGQVYIDAADRHAVAGVVQQDLMEAVDAGMSLGLRAAEGCPHPAQELHDAKRLGDIIVRTAIQPAHGVQLTGFGRDHDDGQPPQGGGVAQLFQDGKAIFARQHHIQDH